MQFPDYPFKSNFLSINGQQMHFLDEGPGNAQPVVMLHGNPSWSFFFRKPVTALRGEYRCIAPDHIGMGLSSKPSLDEYEYSLKNRIDDLESLLEKLEVRKDITLLLHDWGGMIGMAFACRHPDRINRLIILNTAAFHLPAGSILPWQLKIARGPLGPLLIQGFNAFCKSAVSMCVKYKPMNPQTRDAYLAHYSSWNNRIAVLRFVQDIPLKPEEQSYDLVTRVDTGLVNFKNIPMLVCWGMRDFVFTGTFLEQWRKRFPDAEIHTFKDAGHYLLEDAAEEVIPIMRSFLEATA